MKKVPAEETQIVKLSTEELKVKNKKLNHQIFFLFSFFVFMDMVLANGSLLPDRY